MKGARRLTVMQARALLTELHNHPTPSQHYNEFIEGVKYLEEKATAPFCRKCSKPGTEQSKRGYAVCVDHVEDQRDG